MEQVQFNNRITALLGVKYPIVQAGMVWCSGWRLASAVSNAGALGIIGAGSNKFSPYCLTILWSTVVPHCAAHP